MLTRVAFSHERAERPAAGAFVDAPDPRPCAFLHDVAISSVRLALGPELGEALLAGTPGLPALSNIPWRLPVSTLPARPERS